jgi:ankyrin repeat protein
MRSLIECILKRDLVALQNGLADGAHPDERDREGRKPLMNSTIENYIDAARLLIETGAEVDAQDQLGNSALHYAAQEHHAEMATLLITRGSARVDVTDIHGNTPLGRAVFNSRGRGELISILLSAGADRNRRNNHGKSPLDLAKAISNYDIARFF